MLPPEPLSRLQRAQYYLDQGLLDDALAEAYSLVTIDPDNQAGWWFIAQHSSYARQKREALQRVLEINPHFHPAHAIAIQMGLIESPPSDMPTMQTTVPPLPESPESPRTPPSAAFSPVVNDNPVQADSGLDDSPVGPSAVPPSEMRVQYEASPPPPAAQPPTPPRRYDPIQPFLILNGGCSSGCFAGVLTLLAMAALLLFLVWGGINTALHSTKALDQSQSIPADLLPAVAATGFLAFMQANATGLPANLETALTNAGLPLPTSDELYSSALHDLWTSLDYPPNTADMITSELSRVWPRLTAAPWLPLVIFFFGWLIFAFLFVFLRARSRRLLHWGLSTVGLWLLAALAVGIALLVFTFVYGGA